MMKRKVLSVVLVLLLGVVAFVPSAFAQDVSITMWTFLDLNSTNGRAIVLGELIKEFEAANPGIKIAVETQEWSSLYSKVIAAHAAGNAPDIFMVNSENLGVTLKAGCFEPLENLFCKDWTKEDYADVQSAMWNAGFDGVTHYQVPCFYTVYCVYYRSDLFEKFGIQVENIKTWNDLREVAQKLTFVDESGVQVYGLGSGYSTDVTDPQGYLPTILASKEGGMFTEDGYPNDWEGEVGQEAIRFQLKLIEDGIDSESACGISQEELYNAFEAGQYAMIFGGSVRVPTVKSLSAFDPDYVNILANPAMTEDGEKTKTAVAGWHMGVWSGSQKKEAAGKFLGYLMSKEADVKWVTQANQLPLRVSTLNEYSSVFDEPSNAWMKVAADVVANHAYTYSTEYTVSGFSYDLQNAMIRCYVDGLTPEGALIEASESFIARNIGR
jgi:multiple sugar transport system substrate-binding protein